MEIEVRIVFSRAERETLSTALNWIRAEDRDPSQNGIVIALLARDGGGQPAERIRLALGEMHRCRHRLRSNSLQNLPAGLVAPGTDLKVLDDDLWEMALREMKPADFLLEQALAALI